MLERIGEVTGQLELQRTAYASDVHRLSVDRLRRARHRRGARACWVVRCALSSRRQAGRVAAAAPSRRRETRIPSGHLRTPRSLHAARRCTASTASSAMAPTCAAATAVRAFSVRPLVLDDQHGELLAPVVQNGRTDRGMPKFAFTERTGGRRRRVPPYVPCRGLRRIASAAAEHRRRRREGGRGVLRGTLRILSFHDGRPSRAGDED